MSNHAKKPLVDAPPRQASIGGTSNDSRKNVTPRFELARLRPEQAIAVLRPAAEAGNAQAAYMLSLIYEGGAGVPRDEDAAARWFARAAELDRERVSSQIAVRCRELLEIISLHGQLLAAHTAVDPEARSHADEICDNLARLRSSIARLTQLASQPPNQQAERSA
jgi:TPR repeat protein